MNPNRRWLLSSFAALAACSRKPQPPRKIVVQTTPYITMAPLYLAQERGFFAAEDIELVLEESQQSRETIPMLTTGRADVAFAAFSAGIVNAIAKGSRVRIVAGRERFGDNCGDGGALYVRKRKFPKGYSHAPSWVGVHAQVSTLAGYREFLHEKLNEHFGLPPGAIVPEVLRNESALTAAASGKIDVLGGGSRPGYAGADFMKDFERLMILEEILPKFQYSYTLFGARLIDGDPRLGGSFLRALFRGVVAFQAGDTPTYLAEYAKRFKLDYSLVKNACRMDTSSDGEIDTASLQSMLDWCVKRKYIESPVQASALIDPRFLDEARKAVSK